jgi:3-deoxy-D-arabino-heptulosonate 7-phosphate (DAHP) synthase
MEEKETLRIIAGPCSLSETNIEETIEIGKIPEVYGVRACGLKSVTSPRDFMGIDQKAYFEGGEYPSVKVAKRIISETGKRVAFEVMDTVQLFEYQDQELDGKVFVWNPAINQLGYPLYQIAKIAAENRWEVGIKNPKWHGDEEVQIGGVPLTNGEKNWQGNAKYAELGGVKPVMIQRGVDITNKGSYRNIPNHQGSVRMKKLGYEVWLDPSHICGQLRRDSIVAETLNALTAKIDGAYLYSGILIEAGHSDTDSFQHVSVEELKGLIESAKKIRNVWTQ